MYFLVNWHTANWKKIFMSNLAIQILPWPFEICEFWEVITPRCHGVTISKEVFKNYSIKVIYWVKPTCNIVKWPGIYFMSCLKQINTWTLREFILFGGATGLRGSGIYLLNNWRTMLVDFLKGNHFDVVTATTLWLWWPEELAGWNTGVMAEAYIYIYIRCIHVSEVVCLCFQPSVRLGGSINKAAVRRVSGLTPGI
jgi:hypothetical protein